MINTEIQGIFKPYGRMIAMAGAIVKRPRGEKPVPLSPLSVGHNADWEHRK
jgi:hypothetical protein